MPLLYKGFDEYGRRTISEYRNISPNYPLLLGKVVYLRRCVPLKPEIHKDAFEFSYMLKGKQTYEVGGVNYTVNTGEVFITLPDELHSTGGSPFDKSEFFYMIVELKNFPSDFLGTNEQETSTLIAKCMDTFRKNRVIKLGNDAVHYFNTILNIYESNDPLKLTVFRNTLSSLLLYILECSGSQKKEMESCFTTVLQYIDDNCDSNISNETLYKLAGLSKSRFQSKFKEYTGFPPREYVMRKKIEKAKLFLDSSDLSVTDIAFT